MLQGTYVTTTSSRRYSVGNRNISDTSDGVTWDTIIINYNTKKIPFYAAIVQAKFQYLS